jgi:hypothetical protein
MIRKLFNWTNVARKSVTLQLSEEGRQKPNPFKFNVASHVVLTSTTTAFLVHLTRLPLTPHLTVKKKSLLANKRITWFALPTLHTPHPRHSLMVLLDLIQRSLFQYRTQSPTHRSQLSTSRTYVSLPWRSPLAHNSRIEGKSSSAC